MGAETGRACNMYRGENECIHSVGRKSEGKRPLERPRYRRMDNTEMDLREIGCRGMDWTDLAQDRDLYHALVNTVMNLQVM
jgi:hypothetical protein